MESGDTENATFTQFAILGTVWVNVNLSHER